MKNISLTALFTTVILATASTSALAADDSPVAQRVQESLSSQQIVGQAQSATTQQAAFAGTGMSIAASRVEQSLNADMIKGERMGSVSTSQVLDNDKGKSVAATRFEYALNDNA
ncbi:hypothetical protein [Cobetia crustatorum]|uniref:DUF4148 domain-containing protein n=1 Tax=Cobetia crustatorum TaxID=553385 RepID=A0A558HWU3_9GAMM|nr:hypothetical protein [Cobetia crustatorum]TVU73569.1 hypothetical protein FQP86_00340 [Cobetia crustatorum]